MNETTKTRVQPLVLKDHVSETHHFTRHVHVAHGPKVKTKDFPAHGRLKFRVREIVVFWNHGKDVEYIMVYGKNKKTGLTCRKRYNPSKMPWFIAELLGDLKGKQ